jgi:hypothetical protein
MSAADTRSAGDGLGQCLADDKKLALASGEISAVAFEALCKSALGTIDRLETVAHRRAEPK